MFEMNEYGETSVIFGVRIIRK